MSRLHYDQAPQVFSDREFNSPVPGGAARSGGSTNSFLEKVAKLVPSEIIAGYLAMMGFVPQIEGDAQSIAGWGIYGLCQVLTPVYLNTQAEAGKPKLIHLLLSTIAFAIWAYVTTGDKLLPEGYYQAAIGSIVLVAFSLVSAIVPLNR